MIELPEAVVLAQQVDQTLRGKKIERAIANHTPHKFAWYSGDPLNYNRQLADKTLGAASAAAGEVEIQVDGMRLVISAPMRYHPVGAKLPEKHQLLLDFTDQTALTVTIQMWGGIFCVQQGEAIPFEDYALAQVKPNPLTNRFDRAAFGALFNEQTGSLSAKAFLATEQRIPGLGNGVLQDILWTAKIHPKRKMASLSPAEVDQMYAAIKSV
jgi:formamidopyrimidine-DNA glycosylase